MLHKAPAAFGLVTFLLHEQMERTKIRKHLLTFSFAAPTLALITYILLATNGDVGGKVYRIKPRPKYSNNFKLQKEIPNLF